MEGGSGPEALAYPETIGLAGFHSPVFAPEVPNLKHKKELLHGEKLQSIPRPSSFVLSAVAERTPDLAPYPRGIARQTDRLLGFVGPSPLPFWIKGSSRNSIVNGPNVTNACQACQDGLG